MYENMIARHVTQDLIRGWDTDVRVYEEKTAIGWLYTVVKETSSAGDDAAGSIDHAEFDDMGKALAYAYSTVGEVMPTNGNVPFAETR